MHNSSKVVSDSTTDTPSATGVHVDARGVSASTSDRLHHQGTTPPSAGHGLTHRGRQQLGSVLWWWGIPVVLLLLSICLQTALLLEWQPRPQSWLLQGLSGWQKGARSNASVTYGEARGIFPQGCKWRDTQSGAGSHKKELWDVQQYEFWDEGRQRWTNNRPSACLQPGTKDLARHQWRGGSPRTEANCTITHCIYENLWYNNGRFYLLVDGDKPVDGWMLTRNQALNVLHMNNATTFAGGLDARVITGDTLIFDFIYFVHPTAIGHWSEMMFPLFSILRRERDFASTPDTFVLLHLKRLHLMQWVRAVVATTLSLAPQRPLPPLLMQTETDSIWKQVPQVLEGYDPHEWVCFERALVVRDIFTGGVRTFLSKDDARAFRSLIYKQYGLPEPGSRREVPRVITFQRKRANRRVINEDRLIHMLREFGEVRIVEFNSSTSFEHQLRVMASTGVFVSVHTSNLANSQFLQPGSAVVELLQRNWVWHNLDKSFQVQTEVMGDIHHYAWRARHRNQTVYINKRDGERFGNWTHQQCASEECVEAHTNVDVVVNIEELRALLASRLPLVFAGASVKQAAIPWPQP
ncbi:hypothetical protein WJX73_002532 [Symbiochloris irregularis]|uniref:Glycosyltransferase 61 catalytic domain-containing protein n=1 Tax=Symbiochloris irregularis TaxID=706552 RepID=A0AAW1PZ01_9CHLO